MSRKISSYSSDLAQLTQSRFLLAKYRIQVVDPENVEETQLKLSDDNVEEIQKTGHYHSGPEALEYNRNEGICNKDQFMQILWCFLLPCIGLSQCCFRCANSLCDLGAEITTHLEEKYTLTCCLCCDCCKLSG